MMQAALALIPGLSCSLLPIQWRDLGLSTPADNQLTETDVENFIGFVSFLADNDLWDDAKKSLEAAGVTTVCVSSRPIQVIRKMIDDELLPGERLAPAGRKHALVISECGCGVSSPGPPGHGPVVPTGGGDAGTDASTLAPDGG
jgi:hypothetical protein